MDPAVGLRADRYESSADFEKEADFHLQDSVFPCCRVGGQFRIWQPAGSLYLAGEVLAANGTPPQ